MSSEKVVSPLEARLADPKFDLGIKQARLTLDFVTQVEALMKQRRIRRSGLAEMLGRSRQWVTKLLYGGRNLTFHTAVEVANAVGADVQIRVVDREALNASNIRRMVFPTCATPVTFSSANDLPLIHVSKSLSEPHRVAPEAA